MANEVKKLKWGDEYFVVESEPIRQPLILNQLRVDDGGMIIHPPMKPTKPNTKNWKRMTPKRRALLNQYEEDLANYEVAMSKWLELPLLDEGRTQAQHVRDLVMALRNKPYYVDKVITRWSYHQWLSGIFEYEIPVFRYGKYIVFKDKKPIEKYIRSELPEWAVTRHKAEFLEVRHEEIQEEFSGNASSERRHYKRNRSIPKEDWADTNIETGEPCQQTLFTCNTSDARKIVELNILESFIEKPNPYLAEAYLDYILNETPLTDWQKFQLKRRNSSRTWSIH